MTWEVAAAVLSIAALYMPSAQAQCPATGAPVQIEVLPFTETKTVCSFSVNTVNEYAGHCTIPRTPYSKPEAIYKVSLHPGNKNVRFEVTSSTADLVLALLSACGDGSKCVNNSPDHSGPGTEVMPIPTLPYPPGIYFLNVDSNINQVCGYTLTVTGVNPVPDLVVSLTSSPKPVAAGQTLTYALSVTNAGLLDATGAKVTVTFPAGVTVPVVPGCTPTGSTRFCNIGSLKKGDTFTRTIKVTVAPSTRGPLSSTAAAIANEGDQNPADNQKTDTTTAIVPKVHHRHRRHAPRPPPGGAHLQPG